MIRDTTITERFYWLDVLRGLAALSVVLWHWQHFFFDGTIPGQFDVKRLPFSTLAFIFYTKGWLAVDLFFGLSGFVFYCLYSERIANKRVSAKHFAILRASRLYPLHIATLLCVAVLQIFIINNVKSYFVYPNNDVKHFVLNLFFASSWGIESGPSFNGPVWSISIEVLLYSVFFLLCRKLRLSAWTLVIAVGAGICLNKLGFSAFGRGLSSFFLGGLVFLIYKKINASNQLKWWSIGVFGVTITLWWFTFYFFSNSQAVFLTMNTMVRVRYLNYFFQWITQQVPEAWSVLILFPISILSLSLIGADGRGIGNKLSWIGDVSYGIYLIHFPLQMLLFMALSAFGFDKNIYYSPWLMAVFFILLIVISFCSFRYFEKPVQNWMRNNLN